MSASQTNQIPAQSTELYVYTIYIDDASKLCGYAPITFTARAAIREGEQLNLYLRTGSLVASVNWSRVRWYTREAVQP